MEMTRVILDGDDLRQTVEMLQINLWRWFKAIYRDDPSNLDGDDARQTVEMLQGNL